jgi:hypothetical protein
MSVETDPTGIPTIKRALAFAEHGGELLYRKQGVWLSIRLEEDGEEFFVQFERHEDGIHFDNVSYHDARAILLGDLARRAEELIDGPSYMPNGDLDAPIFDQVPSV